jgi:hypothetical protein
VKCEPDSPIARLKRRGKKSTVRERYQRPEVMDLGSKWKIVYWDYSSQPRRKRSKVWSKKSVPSRFEAQRLADEFMLGVNKRNNNPATFPSQDETLSTLLAECRELTGQYLKNSTRKSYDGFFGSVLDTTASSIPISCRNGAA